MRAILLTRSIARLSVAALALGLTSRMPAQQPGGYLPAHHADLSTTLTLTVDGASLQLSPADLAALPQTTVTVHNEHLKADETYTGVAITDLLARAGLAPTRDTTQRLLHSYLRAQGSDFYFVLYSGTEIDSSLHNGSVIIALKKNGRLLGEDGRFKLVSTDDKKPARWVRNLISLTLVSVN